MSTPAACSSPTQRSSTVSSEFLDTLPTPTTGMLPLPNGPVPVDDFHDAVGPANVAQPDFGPNNAAGPVLVATYPGIASTTYSITPDGGNLADFGIPLITPPSEVLALAARVRPTVQLAQDLLRAIRGARTEWFAQYGIRVEDIDNILSLASQMLRVITNRHTAYRRSVRGQLSSVGRKARRLDAYISLKNHLEQCSNEGDELQRRISEAHRCFEDTQATLPSTECAKHRTRLESVRVVADECAAEIRDVFSQLGNLLECLRILTRSPVQFTRFLRSLPIYRTGGRVGVAFQSLMKVSLECDRIRGVVSNSGITPTICQDLLFQAALQDSVFAALEAELRATHTVLDAVHTPAGTLLVSDLFGAISRYELAVTDVNIIRERLKVALEALDVMAQSLVNTRAPHV
ncbi:hypothetical protein C8Q73DRAFT_795986 [Cubamyces lactineus]|nr:hypothetical protein C8Q73DRAFT_795986 [Cubamyces lactineus]